MRGAWQDPPTFRQKHFDASMSVEASAAPHPNPLPGREREYGRGVTECNQRSTSDIIFSL
ncbi:hypothetical protein GCM10010872_19990 [Dyella flava]|nr:hypothetical protein GCM10010872_19990 [Dyella flava]